MTAGLILLAILATVGALFACWGTVGVPVVGARGDLDRACLPLAPFGLEAHGGLQYTAEGAISIFPFGLECDFISADGREHVALGPSWIPTLLVLVAIGLASTAYVVARTHDQRRRS